VKESDFNNMRILRISAIGGKAFVDYLSNASLFAKPKLILHLVFGGQRFKTLEVDACAEPNFNSSF